MNDREPIDRVALRVTRFAGVSRCSASARLDPVRQSLLAEVARCLADGFPQPGTAHDWRGFECGSLRVVGYLKRGGGTGSGTKRKQLWAVRCVCGNHDVRTAAALHRLASGQTPPAQAVCYECQSIIRHKGGFAP